jgi:hypothetical protein
MIRPAAHADTGCRIPDTGYQKPDIRSTHSPLDIETGEFTILLHPASGHGQDSCLHEVVSCAIVPLPLPMGGGVFFAS